MEKSRSLLKAEANSKRVERRRLWDEQQYEQLALLDTIAEAGLNNPLHLEFVCYETGRSVLAIKKARKNEKYLTAFKLLMEPRQVNRSGRVTPSRERNSPTVTACAPSFRREDVCDENIVASAPLRKHCADTTSTIEQERESISRWSSWHKPSSFPDDSSLQQPPAAVDGYVKESSRSEQQTAHDSESVREGLIPFQNIPSDMHNMRLRSSNAQNEHSLSKTEQEGGEGNKTLTKLSVGCSVKFENNADRQSASCPFMHTSENEFCLFKQHSLSIAGNSMRSELGSTLSGKGDLGLQTVFHASSKREEPRYVSSREQQKEREREPNSLLFYSQNKVSEIPNERDTSKVEEERTSDERREEKVKSELVCLSDQSATCDSGGFSDVGNRSALLPFMERGNQVSSSFSVICSAANASERNLLLSTKERNGEEFRILCMKNEARRIKRSVFIRKKVKRALDILRKNSSLLRFRKIKGILLDLGSKRKVKFPEKKFPLKTSNTSHCIVQQNSYCKTNQSEQQQIEKEKVKNPICLSNSIAAEEEFLSLHRNLPHVYKIGESASSTKCKESRCYVRDSSNMFSSDNRFVPERGFLQASVTTNNSTEEKDRPSETVHIRRNWAMDSMFNVRKCVLPREESQPHFKRTDTSGKDKTNVCTDNEKEDKLQQKNNFSIPTPLRCLQEAHNKQCSRFPSTSTSKNLEKFQDADNCSPFMKSTLDRGVQLCPGNENDRNVSVSLEFSEETQTQSFTAGDDIAGEKKNDVKSVKESSRSQPVNINECNSNVKSKCRIMPFVSNGSEQIKLNFLQNKNKNMKFSEREYSICKTFVGHRHLSQESEQEENTLLIRKENTRKESFRQTHEMKCNETETVLSEEVSVPEESNRKRGRETKEVSMCDGISSKGTRIAKKKLLYKNYSPKSTKSEDGCHLYKAHDMFQNQTLLQPTICKDKSTETKQHSRFSHVSNCEHVGDACLPIMNEKPSLFGMPQDSENSQDFCSSTSHPGKQMTTPTRLERLTSEVNSERVYEKNKYCKEDSNIKESRKRIPFLFLFNSYKDKKHEEMFSMSKTRNQIKNCLSSTEQLHKKPQYVPNVLSKENQMKDETKHLSDKIEMSVQRKSPVSEQNYKRSSEMSTYVAHSQSSGGNQQCTPGTDVTILSETSSILPRSDEIPELTLEDVTKRQCAMDRVNLNEEKNERQNIVHTRNSDRTTFQRFSNSSFLARRNEKGRWLSRQKGKVYARSKSLPDSGFIKGNQSKPQEEEVDLNTLPSVSAENGSSRKEGICQISEREGTHPEGGGDRKKHEKITSSSNVPQTEITCTGNKKHPTSFRCSFPVLNKKQSLQTNVDERLKTDISSSSAKTVICDNAETSIELKPVNGGRRCISEGSKTNYQNVTCAMSLGRTDRRIKSDSIYAKKVCNLSNVTYFTRQKQINAKRKLIFPSHMTIPEFIPKCQQNSSSLTSPNCEKRNVNHDLAAPLDDEIRTLVDENDRDVASDKQKNYKHRLESTSFSVSNLVTCTDHTVSHFEEGQQENSSESHEVEGMEQGRREFVSEPCVSACSGEVTEIIENLHGFTCPNEEQNKCVPGSQERAKMSSKITNAEVTIPLSVKNTGEESRLPTLEGLCYPLHTTQNAAVSPVSTTERQEVVALDTHSKSPINAVGKTPKSTHIITKKKEECNSKDVLINDFLEESPEIPENNSLFEESTIPNTTCEIVFEEHLLCPGKEKTLLKVFDVSIESKNGAKKVFKSSLSACSEKVGPDSLHIIQSLPSFVAGKEKAILQPLEIPLQPENINDEALCHGQPVSSSNKACSEGLPLTQRSCLNLEEIGVPFHVGEARENENYQSFIETNMSVVVGDVSLVSTQGIYQPLVTETKNDLSTNRKKRWGMTSFKNTSNVVRAGSKNGVIRRNLRSPYLLRNDKDRKLKENVKMKEKCRTGHTSSPRDRLIQNTQNASFVLTRGIGIRSPYLLRCRENEHIELLRNRRKNNKKVTRKMFIIKKDKDAVHNTFCKPRAENISSPRITRKTENSESLLLSDHKNIEEEADERWRRVCSPIQSKNESLIKRRFLPNSGFHTSSRSPYLLRHGKDITYRMLQHNKKAANKGEKKKEKRKYKSGTNSENIVAVSMKDVTDTEVECAVRFTSRTCVNVQNKSNYPYRRILRKKENRQLEQVHHDKKVENENITKLDFVSNSIIGDEHKNFVVQVSPKDSRIVSVKNSSSLSSLRKRKGRPEMSTGIQDRDNKKDNSFNTSRSDSESKLSLHEIPLDFFPVAKIPDLSYSADVRCREKGKKLSKVQTSKKEIIRNRTRKVKVSSPLANDSIGRRNSNAPMSLGKDNSKLPTLEQNDAEKKNISAVEILSKVEDITERQSETNDDLLIHRAEEHAAVSKGTETELAGSMSPPEVTVKEIEEDTLSICLYNGEEKVDKLQSYGKENQESGKQTRPPLLSPNEEKLSSQVFSIICTTVKDMTSYLKEDKAQEKNISNRSSVHPKCDTEIRRNFHEYMFNDNDKCNFPLPQCLNNDRTRVISGSTFLRIGSFPFLKFGDSSCSLNKLTAGRNAASSEVEGYTRLNSPTTSHGICFPSENERFRECSKTTKEVEPRPSKFSYEGDAKPSKTVSSCESEVTQPVFSADSIKEQRNISISPTTIHEDAHQFNTLPNVQLHYKGNSECVEFLKETAPESDQEDIRTNFHQRKKETKKNGKSTGYSFGRADKSPLSLQEHINNTFSDPRFLRDDVFITSPSKMDLVTKPKNALLTEMMSSEKKYGQSSSVEKYIVSGAESPSLYCTETEQKETCSPTSKNIQHIRNKKKVRAVMCFKSSNFGVEDVVKSAKYVHGCEKTNGKDTGNMLKCNYSQNNDNKVLSGSDIVRYGETIRFTPEVHTPQKQRKTMSINRKRSSELWRQSEKKTQAKLKKSCNVSSRFDAGKDFWQSLLVQKEGKKENNEVRRILPNSVRCNTASKTNRNFETPTFSAEKQESMQRKSHNARHLLTKKNIRGCQNFSSFRKWMKPGKCFHASHANYVPYRRNNVYADKSLEIVTDTPRQTASRRSLPSRSPKQWSHHTVPQVRMQSGIYGKKDRLKTEVHTNAALMPDSRSLYSSDAHDSKSKMLTTYPVSHLALSVSPLDVDCTEGSVVDLDSANQRQQTRSPPEQLCVQGEETSTPFDLGVPEGEEDFSSSSPDSATTAGDGRLRWYLPAPRGASSRISDLALDALEPDSSLRREIARAKRDMAARAAKATSTAATTTADSSSSSDLC